MKEQHSCVFGVYFFFRLHFAVCWIMANNLSKTVVFWLLWKQNLANQRWKRYFFVEFHPHELSMSNYLFHILLSYREQRSYKPSSDLLTLWIEASKLWQVCGKVPFDRNPSAQRKLKFCVNYSRPRTNDDSPEKAAQKASQRREKRM